MATPMIDDIELKAVQYIRQETDQDYVRQKVAGLSGTLHQKLGRASHRVILTGFLLPATATDDLKKLQDKASTGDEVTFTADITTALSVDKMVLDSFRAEQQVGPAGQIAYCIALAESPPLPPPAELSSFGGLDGFGLGDLGFDPGALGGVLSDIQNAAGAVMQAADSAINAVEKLSALANLRDLANIGNPIKPVVDKVGELGSVGSAVQGLADVIRGLTG
jgi:hypothetical protein